MSVKTHKFRAPKILRAANEAPHCMMCRKWNVGNVVAAHANWHEYGKGTGTKAHDWAIAYLCDECHRLLDEGKGTRQDKKEAWCEAHARTMGWLFETGRLVENGKK